MKPYDPGPRNVSEAAWHDLNHRNRERLLAQHAIRKSWHVEQHGDTLTLEPARHCTICGEHACARESYAVRFDNLPDAVLRLHAEDKENAYEQAQVLGPVAQVVYQGLNH